MKTWILRLSLFFNLQVLVLIGYGWWMRGDFVADFLRPNYLHKTSFFDTYQLLPGDVVMLGDSITEGGRWHEIFPQVAVKNRGIGGDTSPGLLDRLDQVTSARAAAIFLKIGTNDLTHGASSEERPDVYREIVTTIRRDAPETALYLQSVLPRDQEYRNEVEAYNRVIKDLADEFGLVYVDLYDHFLAADGSIDDAYSVDELHLNGAGYQLWQSLLEPYMARYRPDAVSSE